VGQAIVGYRWRGEREVRIGYSRGAPAEMRIGAVSLMKDLTGTSPIEVQLTSPLHRVIQLIDDGTTWHALHSFVEVVVGAHIAAAGGDAADDDWRDRNKVGAAIKASVSTPLKRLSHFVSECKKHGTTVIAAQPVSLGGHERNVGVELASDDPEDIAWKLAHLDEFGFPAGLAELSSVQLRGDIGFEQTSDFLIRIEVADNGRVVVFGLPVSGKAREWVAYDPAKPNRPR
jgi:hypothetical protein